MEKNWFLFTVRSALASAAVTAAGIILVRTFLDTRGPFFWLGLAVTAAGLWYLSGAAGNYKRKEAQRIGEFTGLRFRKGYLLPGVDYLEMTGGLPGGEISLRKTDGAARSGVSSEAEFRIKRQAPRGFSLALYPAGFSRRPFGFFPPRLDHSPWGDGTVLRGAPAQEAAAAAERMRGAGRLPLGDLSLLTVSGRELRAVFIKRGGFYDPREIKRLLELCQRLGDAG